MSSKDNEKYSIYTIPYNFIDESKVFGGMIAARNLIEGCVLGGIASIPIFLVSFPLQIKFTLILVCFLVFGVVGCIGINGDPISRFIIYFIQFRKQKRIIMFNGKIKFHESAADNIEFSELPRDRVLKLFVGMSFSRKAAEESSSNDDAENFVFDDDIVSEENRQDIISKLLGKKNTAIYDNTYDLTVADEYLYGDNNFENSTDEMEADTDFHELHAEFSQNDEIVPDIDFDNIPNTDEFDFKDDTKQDYSESIEFAVDIGDIAYEDEPSTMLNIDETDLIEQGIETTMEESEESFIDVSVVMRNAMQTTEWQCKFCGTINDGKFCEECGSSKETAEVKKD